MYGFVHGMRKRRRKLAAAFGTHRIPGKAAGGPWAAKEAPLFSAARQPEVGRRPRDWSTATPGGLISVYRDATKIEFQRTVYRCRCKRGMLESEKRTSHLGLEGYRYSLITPQFPKRTNFRLADQRRIDYRDTEM